MWTRGVARLTSQIGMAEREAVRDAVYTLQI